MIPDINDKRWEELILNPKRYQFHLLSLKILMSRVYGKLKSDPSKENIDRCKMEVYDFFVKNEQISRNDLNLIFERI